jgi:hypothetical protein
MMGMMGTAMMGASYSSASQACSEPEREAQPENPDQRDGDRRKADGDAMAAP